MENDFSIVHRDAVKNQAADTLWCLPTEETDNSDSNDDIAITTVITGAQKKLNEVTDVIATKNHVETSEL